MKQYVIDSDLREDVITYITNSSSSYTFNQVQGLLTLVKNLQELSQVEVLSPFPTEEQLLVIEQLEKSDAEPVVNESVQQQG